MKITLKRIAKKANYTIGHLYIDGEKFCDTIEDTVRDLKTKSNKVYGETAIPCGTYDCEVVYAPRFKRRLIWIKNVPFFEGIMIHKGNTQKDSLGCIIVGDNDRVGWVSNPSKYEQPLVKLVDAVGGKCTITIL